MNGSIALGCDEAAFQLKEKIRAHLESKGLKVDDFGVYSTDPSLYPDIARRSHDPLPMGNIRRPS